MKDRLNELIRFECSPKLVMSLGVIAFTACTSHDVAVTVSNETAMDLGPRCIEVSAPEVLGRLGSAGFYVTDESGRELVSQLTSDSLILFMAEVPPGESRRYAFHPSDSVRSYPKTVSGRFYPKRRDDVAYENELVGFRIYGPGTQKAGERSFGYDLFLKHPSDELIVPQLYAPETDDAVWAKVDSLRKIDDRLAEDFIKTFSYHLDHGLGMDCYAVGPTLGAGVAAVLDGDSVCYPWCYGKGEILDDGPLRFTLRLDFAPVPKGKAHAVAEHRLITLDSRSHLNRARVWYEGLEGNVAVAAGFPLRDGSEVVEDAERGIIAYADPTQGPDNGRALVGVSFGTPPDTILRRDGHALLVCRLAPRDTLDYRWGFAWDRTDITTLPEWKRHLDSSGLDYAVSLR